MSGEKYDPNFSFVELYDRNCCECGLSAQGFVNVVFV